LPQYLPILSHDVRTPLTAIKGAAGVLIEGFGGPLSENQLRLVKICHRNADIAALLVQDVVELLRLQTGLAEIHPVEFDAVLETRETVEDLPTTDGLPIFLECTSERAVLRADRHFFRRSVCALARFQQPYPSVASATLSLAPLPDGAELSLVCGPLALAQTALDGMLRDGVRGQRQVEGRLHATGLELAFLSALSCRFPTSIVVEARRDGRVGIRLSWRNAA